MKIKHTLIILFLIVLISPPVTAQQNTEVLKKRVTLPASTLRVDSLLQELAKQTGIRFSFNPVKISPSRKIYFRSRQQTIEQVLIQVQQTIGARYKLVGNHIILLDEGRTSVPKKPVVVNAVKKKEVLTSKLTVKNLEAKKTTGASIADTRESHAVQLLTDTNSKKDSSTIFKNISNDTSQTVTIPVRDSISVKLTKDTGMAKDSIVAGLNVQKKPVKKNAASLQGFAVEGGLPGLGINYVLNTGQYSQLEFSAGLGGGYFITGKQFYYAFNFLKPSLYTKAQLKIYLKNDINREGGYFGLSLKYSTAHLWSTYSYDSSTKWLSFKRYVVPALLTDAHLGIQKQLNERWRIDGHLGIGYSFDFAHRWGLNHWYPAAGLKISYKLNESKK